jgi:hypothetical protein
MATTYAIGGSSGNAGGTHTIQSQDNAQRVRYYDLALLMEGATGNNQLNTARPGVLVGGDGFASGVPQAMRASASGSGLTVNLFLGAAVVERTTLVGSYLVTVNSTGVVTLTTANGINPRIDRIDLQVFDGAKGDNGGTSLTQYLVTTGVAAGSPSPPAAPSNSIPIAQITVAAGQTVLTGGEFADKRRSTAPRGAIRPLLPGDAVTDPGFMLGELRDTSVVATQGTIDRWNVVTGVWDTLALTGAGAGQARYRAASSGTQVLAAGSNLVQFPVADYTCPDVVASGTNNTTFTFQRGGLWRITADTRIGDTTASITRFLQISDAALTQVYGTDDIPSPAAGAIVDMNCSAEQRFAAGASVVINAISSATGSIDHPNAALAGRTAVSFTWVRA